MHHENNWQNRKLETQQTRSWARKDLISRRKKPRTTHRESWSSYSIPPPADSQPGSKYQSWVHECDGKTRTWNCKSQHQTIQYTLVPVWMLQTKTTWFIGDTDFTQVVERFPIFWSFPRFKKWRYSLENELRNSFQMLPRRLVPRCPLIYVFTYEATAEVVPAHITFSLSYFISRPFC